MDTDFPPLFDFSDPAFADTIPASLRELKMGECQDVRGALMGSLKDPHEILLEKYPRIYAIITYLWGRQELQNMFGKWLLTDQEGRVGWPNDAYEALIKLANYHADVFDLEAKLDWEAKPDRW